MAFRDFLENIFGGGHDNEIHLTGSELICLEQAEQLWYMKLAQHIIAEKYGALLSKCEWKTFIKGEEVKKDNWYLFNVEPNENQSSSEFVKQLVRKLIFDMEALIIITDKGKMFIADSFTKGEYQMRETYFKDVTVNVYGEGEYQLQGTFSGDKAIYIKYNNKGALNLIKQMNSLYSSLVDNVKRSGSNKIKYLLNIDTTALNGVGIDINKEIQTIINKDFQKLISDNDVIMPILKGFDLKVLNTANDNAQNSTTASDGVNRIYSNLMVNIGQLYNMPSSFMLGTYEADDMDDFLTFGLDPFADLISECFNRKFYGQKAYMNGTYCQIDTRKVKHFDILTVASAVNQLISSGVYTINELRTILDEQPVDAEIGDKHWITRNYAVVGDYIQELNNFAQTSETDDQQQEVGV